MGNRRKLFMGRYLKLQDRFCAVIPIRNSLNFKKTEFRQISQLSFVRFASNKPI
jgi:hypothetical protein